MFVSHFDSETRRGYTALLSSRYTELLEALRRALSPADFAFAQKVGLALFDRLEPEAVIMAGMTSAFVNRPLVRDTAFPILDDYERSLTESAFAIFSDPIGAETPSPAVGVIVRTLALTILSESSATRPTPLSQSPSEHWTTAESLHTIEDRTRHTNDHDDLGARMLDWCRRQGIDPDWARNSRPVYRLCRRTDMPVTDPAISTTSDGLSPMDRIRRLCRAAGFPTVDDEAALLVRADANRQPLLDRLVLSIASHEPQICVRATDDFPQAPEAWQWLSLTLDRKRDIYRRQALLRVTDVDPYPAMLRLLGRSTSR